MFFAACSVGGWSSALMCSTIADVSGAPAMRSARAKARRRIASLAHCGLGCSHAPRPGRVPAGSTVTAYLPFPVDTATTRSSSTANSRFRQPTHVRTGPSVRRCAEAEISRWITVQLTCTQPVVRTTRIVRRPDVTWAARQARRSPPDRRRWAATGPAPRGDPGRRPR